MKKIFITFLLLSFFNLMTLPAQSACYVSAGRKIPLVYVGEKLTGKDLSSGDKINVEIQTDVKINNIVVFKQGDEGTLNVADARKARFWGNPGEMLLINGTVQDVKGNPHPVEFTYKITGTEKTWPKVMGAISIFFLFPLALFGFVKGGQAELLPNKTINVTLLNDFTL